MAIDTGIYQNVRPFTMADPYESAAKAMAIQEAQRKFTLQDDIQRIGAETGGDPEQMSKALLAKGHYAPAIQLQSQAAELRQKQAAILKEEQTRFTGLLPLLRNELARVGDDAGLAQLRAKTAALASGFTAPQFQQMLSSMAREIPERFDQNWKLQQLMTADDVIKKVTPKVELKDTGGNLTPVQVNPDAEGGVRPLPGVAPIPKTAAPQGPTGDMREYEFAKSQGYQGTFEKWQTDQKKAGAAAVTVNTGPMTPSKPAQTDIDKGMLDATAGLMQLDAINNQFKPEYQTWATRGEQAWNAIKEKGGIGLKNKEKADLEAFSKYKRNAIDSMNKYIKSITGAAMTNEEAKRILAGLPSVGDGIFDGDSPTQFKAKLDDAMKQTKMAIARFAYMKRNGLSLDDGKGNAVVPLERMPALINERGREIEGELKKAQPGANAQALSRAVRRQLSVEFGLAND